MLSEPSDTQLIYNGDCRRILDVLGTCTGLSVPCIFADPPDNLGLAYDGYLDKIPPGAYVQLLREVVYGSTAIADVFWLSYYYAYAPTVYSIAADVKDRNLRHVYWRFNFGQHRDSDFGNGLRPIARFSRVSWQPDTEAVKVQSVRQQMGDARAKEGGRVPDDCWDFPRVTGNANERRPWHPTQHNELLMERLYKCSHPAWAIDLFGGTGTSLRVCHRLNIPHLTCEQSSLYCDKMAMQTGAKVTCNESLVREWAVNIQESIRAAVPNIQ